MDKPISSLMEKHVVTIRMDDTVEKVKALLDSHKLSCVPIVDSNGGCFGIISAADLIHFDSMHKNQKVERAWEVCTHKVIEVSPNISVKEAAELMVKKKIHHIVVTENKSIKGIVSSIDFIKGCLLKQNT